MNWEKMREKNPDPTFQIAIDAAQDRLNEVIYQLDSEGEAQMAEDLSSIMEAKAEKIKKSFLKCFDDEEDMTNKEVKRTADELKVEIVKYLKTIFV